jgi:hypothetical protein
MKISIRSWLLVLALLAIPTSSFASDSNDGDLPALRGPQKVLPKQHLKPLTNDADQADWHIVRMELHGSMCPACLLELQEQLSRLPAIQGVNIVQSKFEAGRNNELRLDKYANAAFIVDEKLMTLADLRSIIKVKEYNCKDVLDEPLGRLPVEEDLRVQEIRNEQVGAGL